MAKGYCPECDGEVKFNGPPRKGQAVTCPTCGTDLVVARVSPIELDWANGDWEAMEYETFDDEDEDEDDDSDFD